MATRVETDTTEAGMVERDLIEDFESAFAGLSTAARHRGRPSGTSKVHAASYQARHARTSALA